MYEVYQGQSWVPLVFLMVSNVDHKTGVPGAVPTVTIAKNGYGFLPPAGAVREIGGGYYQVLGNPYDSSILGPLLLHATAPYCDPTDRWYSVVLAPVPARDFNGQAEN